MPRISTSMFADLSYENSLKDVFALTNPNVENRVMIEDGVYTVRANEPSDVCISVNSNTKILLNGIIIIEPNDYPNYSIIKTIGSNIEICGEGIVRGDKQKHYGEKGEWGMGVYILGGQHIQIKGITISDCWGDCIYITQKAKDVIIDKCKLDNSRRQRISIISAYDVTIKNCEITNVEGTNPQYAIDVEPNANDSVDNVGYLKSPCH